MMLEWRICREWEQGAGQGLLGTGLVTFTVVLWWNWMREEADLEQSRERQGETEATASSF